MIHGEIILEGVEEQISQQRCAVSAHWYANNLPKNWVSEADVDIVDKKFNSEAQFPTGEVSVLRRLPIISPECVEIIGCYETLPPGVKNPLE